MLLIGRAAEMLASHWLSTAVLPFVGFLILCPKTTNSLKFFGVRLIVCTTNTWKSSAAATKKIPETLNFRISYKKQQKIIYVKDKNLGLD